LSNGTIVNNNPVNFRDPLGLDVKVDPELQDEYNAIKNTPTGGELIESMENDSDRDVWIMTNEDGENYHQPETDIIMIDPNSHPLTDTTDGVLPASTESILAHEIGHAATGIGDTGEGNMDNVLYNENPIRKELGEPERTKY